MKILSFPSEFVKQGLLQFGPRTWLRGGLNGGLAVVALFSSACLSVKTEHKVEPIQITMDINVRLERELESAFSELDERAKEIAAAHEPKGDLPE